MQQPHALKRDIRGKIIRVAHYSKNYREEVHEDTHCPFAQISEQKAKEEVKLSSITSKREISFVFVPKSMAPTWDK